MIQLAAPLAVAIAMSRGAPAQTTTDESGSILIFPRVVFDAQTDSVIRIISTGNTTVSARCFYIDGATQTQTAFGLFLTRQQPTHWVVSRGRPLDPSDPVCSPSSADCDGAGLDPGFIPPVVEGFRGELRCVEVSASNAPVAGNHLSGVAVLEDRTSGGATQYSAVAIRGNPDGESGATLMLDGNAYESCPQTWILNHVADGADDPQVGAGSSLFTELTIVPCSYDLEHRTPGSTVVQVAVFGEFGQRLTTSFPVHGWRTSRLSEIDSPRLPERSIFHFAVLGSLGMQTRLRAAGPGFVPLALELHQLPGSPSVTRATVRNVHRETTPSSQPDTIQLPEE